MHISNTQLISLANKKFNIIYIFWNYTLNTNRTFTLNMGIFIHTTFYGLKDSQIKVKHYTLDLVFVCLETKQIYDDNFFLLLFNLHPYQ